MQTSETRNINQCTYTPIEARPEIFIAKQPFLLQGILGVVFDRQELTEIITREVSESRRSEILPLPRLREIKEAVNLMWKGDMSGTVKILRDLDVQEIVQFAKEALKVEKLLLQKAQKDLDDAVLSLEKRGDVNAESVAELRREMNNMRETILSEVHRIVAPLTAKLDRATGQETFTTASTVENFAEYKKEKPPFASLMQPIITQEMIRSELRQHAPVSLTLLEAIGVFSMASTAELMPVPYEVLLIRLEKSQQKEKMLEMIIKQMKVEPVGWLHLERLQFTPVGYERGELVYSLPILPGETVRLSHREWSRTETEFSKLVYTQLETASEEALSEKSEITQSTNTQQQHTSGHNASVTASGGCGPVNITSSYSYNCSDSESKSRQSSAKRSQDITKKASSRVKKEHKVSFKVTTTYELEETSFREITNQSDQAIRWDFHRLMKKWRIDLYRYDIRLTYDIVIPEPGSYLLRKYILLKAINDELAKPIDFSLSPLNIDSNADSKNLNSWVALSEKYGVSLEPPPIDPLPLQFGQKHTYSGEAVDIMEFLELNLPDGYEFEFWEPHGSQISKGNDSAGTLDVRENSNNDRLNAGAKHGQRFNWRYYYGWSEKTKPTSGDQLTIVVDVTAKPTTQCLREWQMQCYEQIADAAKAQYESKQQRLKQIRDELLEELNREDALMLRKLEKEEIMKGVLRWMLGPTFSFYPQNTLKLPDLTLPQALIDSSITTDIAGNLEYYDPKTHSVKQEFWKPTLVHGEILKFLHQAIEWENVNYILYPYFWTDEPRWDFKQFLYHNDYVHRSFLRSGAARVVLTIRRGFEKDFLSFMEGSLDKVLEGGHHYMSISDELEAMAKTHYPYTQDANTEKKEYIFTWQNVPGNEEGKLKRYLRQNFYVDWAEDNETVIAKQDGDKTIMVSIDKTTMIGGVESSIEGSVEIKIDVEKNTASLRITDDKTYNLKVVKEGNNLKLYREQNLVDTWYEYTPTGALDVAEGKVLD